MGFCWRRRRDVRHKDEAPNGHNILANFVPCISRRKRRKRLASQAAEPCGNMSFIHTFMLTYDGNLSLLEMNLCRKGSSLFSASAATKKCAPPFGVRIFLLWRRRRDSNPRTAFDGYTISSRAPSTKLGDSSTWQLDEAENKTARSNCRSERERLGKPNETIIYYPSEFDKCFTDENPPFSPCVHGVGVSSLSVPNRRPAIFRMKA